MPREGSSLRPCQLRSRPVAVLPSAQMESAGNRHSIVVGVVAIALVVGSLALLWGASEAHFRGCVEEAEARYPPIAVSAFSGEQTGPLKVAYDKERAQALDSCSRAPW